MEYKFEPLEEIADKVKNGSFDVYPYSVGITLEYGEEVEKVARAAREFGKPCVCKRINENGEKYLCQSCAKGCSARFLVFNAEETSKENADMHVFVHNTGLGALTQYWWSKHIKACVGSFV